MTINENTTWVPPKGITVWDVYGCLPEPPKGYKFRDFRPPKRGEEYLLNKKEVAKAYRSDGCCVDPLLILEPIPMRKQLIFTEIDRRAPHRGEWFYSQGGGSILKCCSSYEPEAVRIIYSLEEKEI